MAAVEATDCAIEGTVNWVSREDGRGLRSTPLDTTGSGAGARTATFAGVLAAALTAAFAGALTAGFAGVLAGAFLAAALAAVEGALVAAVDLLVVAFNSVSSQFGGCRAVRGAGGRRPPVITGPRLYRHHLAPERALRNTHKTATTRDAFQCLLASQALLQALLQDVAR